MKAAMAIGLFFPAFLWVSAAMADCKCMANGRVFHHGEIACLRLPSGPQLAQCGMVLNNSSWIKLQDGCPVAETGENVLAGPVISAPVTSAPMMSAPMTSVPHLRLRTSVRRS